MKTWKQTIKDSNHKIKGGIAALFSHLIPSIKIKIFPPHRVGHHPLKLSYIEQALPMQKESA
jgi:hypothetical protein